jgi:hypothetical protein
MIEILIEYMMNLNVINCIYENTNIISEKIISKIQFECVIFCTLNLNVNII